MKRKFGNDLPISRSTVWNVSVFMVIIRIFRYKERCSIIPTKEFHLMSLKTKMLLIDC